ncbi:hypothetical protein AGDE_09419 [Angomonas deanei]|uniref:Uncharacterized protein n=1 Tax=Angomonas deanei TaxID=59799 RepID=A0A7G2C348_9TRYP|nr:hypothetical protein AGDE_09419 [Angomonas deanei]CAD2214116.1 hypothetical protein, conserved [Angomonas deanei]|eukprot:EPY30487.1 hypothetical protein AGDE_09419 [Angomonas deanei]
MSVDGNIGDVDPVLLSMSSDPEAWREQRRQKMREKIFGQGGKGETTEAKQPDAKPSNTSTSTEQDEKYILQQLRMHKRKREAGEEEAPLRPPQEETTPNQPSLKERLMKKYS